MNNHSSLDETLNTLSEIAHTLDFLAGIVPCGGHLMKLLGERLHDCVIRLDQEQVKHLGG
jgi:hypothetical protein